VGLALIVIGIVLALLVSWWIGVLCIVIGLVLLLVPGTPYGYSWYRGRRGPPA
jgi:hypothetical protein